MPDLETSVLVNGHRVRAADIRMQLNRPIEASFEMDQVAVMEIGLEPGTPLMIEIVRSYDAPPDPYNQIPRPWRGLREFGRWLLSVSKYPYLKIQDPEKYTSLRYVMRMDLIAWMWEQDYRSDHIRLDARGPDAALLRAPYNP